VSFGAFRSREEGERWYADMLRRSGLPEERVASVLAEMRRETACLDAGECPKCGARLARRLDPRQAGCSNLPGDWHNYRCAGCGYACDRKE
jgi:hypothetical protein